MISESLQQPTYWPGNMRKLRNFVKRLILLSDLNKITKELIDEMLSQKYTVSNTPKTNITNDLKTLECDYISFLFKKFGNNKDKLCEYLNISKPTLWRKLNKQ